MSDLSESERPNAQEKDGRGVDRCLAARGNNPTLPEDCGEDEVKLRGDAIGSTLYSERWLLKILMTLSKFTQDSWSEQLEDQLCSLWDMTFESDVIVLLLKHDFIELAHHILQATSEPRLIEILIGILGNMANDGDVRQCLSQSSITELLFGLLSTSDTLTLLQLTRLLNCCVWHVNKVEPVQNEDHHADHIKEMTHWISLLTNHSSTLNKNLAFMLSSSTNEELLLSTLELLNNLCCVTLGNTYFNEFLATPEMLAGLIEALSQLLSENSQRNTKCYWGKDAEKACQLWASVLNSFTLHDPGIEVIYSHRQNVMLSICRIFDPLGSSENLLPLDSCKLDILDSVMTVLETLGCKREYTPAGILPRVLTIIPFLSTYQEDRNIVNGQEIVRRLESTDKNVSDFCIEVCCKFMQYCVTALHNVTSIEFIEAFGENPRAKINVLLESLITCNDSEVENFVTIIKGYLTQ